MAIEFSGIASEIASQLRLDYTKSDQKTLIDRWINLALEDIHGRHDWWWTKDRQVIQTVADKTDGTIALLSGGTTVTGTDTAFASTDVGSFIQFDNNDDWYKIIAVDSTTSLTIESPFNGTAELTASEYTIRKFYYPIPSAEKILGAKQWGTPTYLPVHPIRDFDKFHQLAKTTGDALEVYVWSMDSSYRVQLLVYPWADEARNIEVRYKKTCTEDSVAYFPAKWRGVIIDGGLVRGLKYVAVGNPQVTPALIDRQEAAYERGIARMLADPEPDSEYMPEVRSCEEVIEPVGPDLPEDYS